MNIVENKKKCLEYSNMICDELILMISKKILNYKCDDDPAENIYLLGHICSNINAKIFFILEEYSKTYDIKSLDEKFIKKWVHTLTEEYIKILKETPFSTNDKKTKGH